MATMEFDEVYEEIRGVLVSLVIRSLVLIFVYPIESRSFETDIKFSGF
jgi:hypothetical protein